MELVTSNAALWEMVPPVCHLYNFHFPQTKTYSLQIMSWDININDNTIQRRSPHSHTVYLTDRPKCSFLEPLIVDRLQEDSFPQTQEEQQQKAS